MSAALSLSVFTVEADRRPVLAIQGRKHSEAEVILGDEYLREQLRLLKSDGKHLCDDFSVLRLRIARADERARYYGNAASLLTSDGQLAVLLVTLDNEAAN